MSPRGSPPPLNDTDYHAINKQLENLARLQQDIAQAIAAGCDASEQNSHCLYLKQQLEQIKRVYFPNKP